MSRLKVLSNRSNAVEDQPVCGPSTPRKADAHRQPTTYHRKMKALIGELRASMAAYNEAVGPEGQLWRAAQGLVNMGTQIDNTLSIEPGPSRAPITPAYDALVKYRQALEDALGKIHKLIQKLRLLVDTAEQLLFEALTLKDPSFALETPFWDVVAPGAEAFDAVYAEQATGTWTMKQLVESLSPCTSLHAEHLATLNSLLDRLRDPERYAAAAATAAAAPKQSGATERVGPDRGVGGGGGGSVRDAVTDVSLGEVLPYDRHALFDVQRTALEAIADRAARSELARWRDEWIELVECEMRGYEASEEAQTGGGGAAAGSGAIGSATGSPKTAAGGSNSRRRRGGSVEP